MGKAKKTKEEKEKQKALQQKKKLQTDRLLILSKAFFSLRWVLLVEEKLRYKSTHINPVHSCDDITTINRMIDTSFTIRANTYNLLGSISFWNKGWHGTQKLVAEVFGAPSTYAVGEKTMPSKLFEWCVQDTAKNILASQAAAKKEIIKDIYKLPGLQIIDGEKLTKSQKQHNKEVEKVRKELIRIIDKEDFETIAKYPLLHRLLRKHYHRGHCKQCRQIVFQPQAYKCTRINRHLVRLQVQSPVRGVKIDLVVKSRRIISGQIRLIRNDDGSLEVHSLVEAYFLRPDYLVDRQQEIGVDRGYTEVLWTSDNECLGKGFGKEMTKKADRITKTGRNRNRLYALKEKLELLGTNEAREKAKNIEANNLGRKKQDKLFGKDESTIESVVNRACKQACKKADTIVVENLVEQFRFKDKRMSRKARNKLNQWMKGLVIERLKHWAGIMNVELVMVNAAYTSQVDHRNGTLLGHRDGDRFVCFDGVVLQSDHNGAMVVKSRKGDKEIGLYMKYPDVAGVLLERTAKYLKKLGKTLTEAVELGWLDPKHKIHPKFRELSTI